MRVITRAARYGQKNQIAIISRDTVIELWFKTCVNDHFGITIVIFTDKKNIKTMII